MDPRHPELAVARIKELIKQYDDIEKKINSSVTSLQISQLEREGGLVVQEICLVAPRIHEAMMQTSRQRRHDLSRGILIEPQDIAVQTPQGGMFEPEIVEKPVEKPIEKPIEGLRQMIEEDFKNSLEKVDTEKPKKKTTRKKKNTKKVEE